ncbi:hypothetical protein EBQ81_04855 [bacterium]|nr:hypothetical protein [bacterium]
MEEPKSGVRKCVLKFSEDLGMAWYADLTEAMMLVDAARKAAQASNRGDHEYLLRVESRLQMFRFVMGLTIRGLESKITPEEEAAAVDGDEAVKNAE